jgi:uncharacterized membrane protein (UPF0127 family)
MGRASATPRRFRRLRTTAIQGRSIPVADRIASRLLGLACLSRRRAGPGLLIPRCRSVHTFGMRFGLDLLFLDHRGGVIEVRRDVPPGRIVRVGDAVAVLELPAAHRRR